MLENKQFVQTNKSLLTKISPFILAKTEVAISVLITAIMLIAYATFGAAAVSKYEKSYGEKPTFVKVLFLT
jgi:hypothetical protein